MPWCCCTKEPASKEVARRLILVKDSANLENLKPGAILDNTELFKPTDVLYKISVEDFLLWTVKQVVEYSYDEDVMQAAHEVLYPLFWHSIVLQDPLDEYFNWVQDFQGPCWMEIQVCFYEFYEKQKNMDKLKDIYHCFISKLLKKGDLRQLAFNAYQYFLTFTSVKILREEDQGEAAMLYEEIMEPTKGLLLLKRILAHMTTNECFGHIFESLAENFWYLFKCMKPDKKVTYLTTILQSDELMKKMTRVLPSCSKMTSILQNDESRLLHEHLMVSMTKGISYISNVMVELSEARDEFIKQFDEMGFLGSLVATLEAFQSLDWGKWGRGLELVLMVDLFSILYKLEDPNFSQTTLARLPISRYDDVTSHSDSEDIASHTDFASEFLDDRKPLLAGFIQQHKKWRSKYFAIDSAVLMAARIFSNYYGAGSKSVVGQQEIK